MRSTIILVALSGSALAMPFGDTFNSIFARAERSDKMYRPHNHEHIHHHPIPTGTGYPIPTGGFPTGTSPSGPIPTESGGMNALPFPNPGLGLPVVSKGLSIDYKMAPTSVAPMEKRVAIPTGAGFPHPKFGFPQSTGGPLPTGGFPTGGYPTGGFPTGGFPTGIPTTLATFTKGPLPTGTAAPEFPGADDDEGTWYQDLADKWAEWMETIKGE
jgi:hypothetical protein